MASIRACTNISIVAAIIGAVLSVQAGDQIVWKPVTAAVLKVDNQPAKIWNVYQAAKNHRLVLIQIWRRYLLLDIKAQQAFDIDPNTLEKKGAELRGRAPEKRDKALPTTDWDLRDVGFAEMVRFTLDGRVLEVQLPHPLDPRVAY